MRKRVARRGVLRPGFRGAALGLVCLLAPPLEAAEKPTPLETARWAADLNARSPEGRDWLQRHRAKIDELIVPVLTRCVGEDGEEITAFTVFIRTDRKGSVREVLTELDESLGACMTAGSRELRFPEAPRDDYWFSLNLAAAL